MNCLSLHHFIEYISRLSAYSSQLLMLMAWLAVITHDLHPPYHGSDCEET